MLWFKKQSILTFGLAELFALLLMVQGAVAAPLCSGVFAEKAPASSWQRAMDFRAQLEDAIVNKKNVSEIPFIVQNLELMQKSLKKMPAQLGIELSGKIAQLRLQKKISYDDYLNLSTEYFFLADNKGKLTAQDLKSAAVQERFKSYKGYAERNFIFNIEDGWIQIPLRSELSVAEMNQLWTLALLPMGLIEGTARVDGQVFKPFDFLLHDEGHASRYRDRIKSDSMRDGIPQRKIYVETANFYNKMQNKFQSESIPQRLQDFIEVEFFIASHEGARLFGPHSTLFYEVVRTQDGKPRSNNELREEAKKMHQELNEDKFGRQKFFGYKDGKNLTVEDFYQILVFFAHF